MLLWLIQERRERKAEAASRDHVMEDLDAFRISLGRANYMHEIERAITGASECVVFTSATMATSWNSDHQKRVVEAVLEQQKQHPSYTHRGVVAKRVEALPGTLELLCETNVDVRLSDIMLMSRLRFVVRDYAVSVIGVAEGEPSLEHQPETKRSFSVESTMLSGALRDRFDRLWDEASKPWEYLDQLIAAATKSHSNYTRNEVFNLLGLDEDRRKTYAPKIEMNCPSFKALPS